MPSLRIAGEDFHRGPRAVSAAEARADLDRALLVFDQAYAGVDGLPRVPDEGRIEAARTRLASRRTWEPDAFARALLDLLRAPDGHLAFGYFGDGARAPLVLAAWPRAEPYLSEPLVDRVDTAGALWLGARRIIGCELDLPAGDAVLSDAGGGYRIGTFLAPPEGSLLCLASAAGRAPVTSLSFPLRRPDAREPSRHGPAVELSGGDVPVLAIRTFDEAAEPALRALPRIARALRQVPSFVVDLRGNAGGNYAHAEAFVLALTDAVLEGLDEREVVSVAAAEGRANGVRRRLLAGDVPRDAVASFEAQIAVLESTAHRLREEGARRAEVVTAGRTLRGRAPGPLRSRAVFLVDGGCASACEMLLALARQIPGVAVAGRNTRGGMAVGELALFRLPSSGLTISLGTRAFRDPLRDFVETRGFLPDVWIDGADALEAAQRLATAPQPPEPLARRDPTRVPRLRRLAGLARTP